MNSTTSRNVFDRPDLLESQTRLILSADTKPKRLARSAHRSAVTVFARDRSNSAASISVIREVDDDLLDEHSHDEDDSLHPASIRTKEINYDSDIEPDEEPIRDFSSRGVYLDQCRRYGVIPSSYFLQKLENQTLDLRYSALKPIQIKVMIPALKINTHITKLDFRANGLGSNGVIYIAELVKENEYLVELNLADNDIGLQGKVEIFSSKSMFYNNQNEQHSPLTRSIKFNEKFRRMMTDDIHQDFFFHRLSKFRCSHWEKNSFFSLSIIEKNFVSLKIH